ncbi:MAG: hypothetical protein R2726_09880 [Acidimicrobiales bacterium]
MIPSGTQDPSLPYTRRSAAGTARRVLRRIREHLGDDPTFLPVVLRATPLGVSRRLTDTTDLVIEGFPRSGNTFAYFAMRLASGDRLRIASHVHTPSQVKAAVALHLPTMLVVREPRDTVVSLLIAAPHVAFRAAIAEWIHHHRELLAYRNGFVVAGFDQVTHDLGRVVERVNERFGTDLPRFEPTPANTDAVFAAIEEHHQRVHGGTENVVPRPSPARQAERRWLLEQLAAPRFDELWAEAEVVHRDLTAGLSDPTPARGRAPG